MKKFFLHLTLIISLFTISAKAQTKIIVSDLKCEMLTNPEGIDVLQPRLSWKIKAEVNDVKQTHYQILASSSLEKLNAGNADLWDSGKVQSDESINVIYNGKKLKDRQDVYWKVNVFTNKGEIQSKETAHFSIGILTYADWK
jgi:alpha-L-rhamnosidase